MSNLKIPLLACILSAVCMTRAQTEGPFPPENWPATVDPDAIVHYVSVDDFLFPPGFSWITGNMSILSGGDQLTEPITIGGYNGLKVTGNYLNVADFEYPEWADDEEIDILMQVWGDGALFNSSGEPRDFNFLIGALPDLDAPAGGQIPLEARNQMWNWVLFRIPNTIRDGEGGDGLRRVGNLAADAEGATQAGGVNGGTIRVESVPNLIVRAVAFGEVGAFGEPEQINIFAEGEDCPDVPETNLAWIDLNTEQSDHMQVLNDQDQTTVISEDIGPEGDKRRAVRPEFNYMNIAVTDGYLGLGCNDAQTVKICVEYYDDPALTGVRFGPEAYATDSQGGIGFVPQEQYQTLAGTGTWQRRAWIIPSVNLFGVNTAPLTAGPRFYFDVPVYISQFNLGILRAGNHPLAGQDPLPDCFSDPNFCSGIYGNFAEMDLANGILDGLAPGTSGGDQEMIEGEAGPANDRRWAVRPARDDGSGSHAHGYLNFAITDEKLGPTIQPGVRLAICVTYYDDPALVGATFRPEVYISDRGGTTGFAFVPADLAVPLEGTDTWREAYFELTDVKFSGVNQGPQAAARFAVSDKIYFTRVRYGVIRPCGPEANVNPLEECKPPPAIELLAGRNPDGTVRIAWPLSATGYVLQENVTVGAGTWSDVSTAPAVEGEENVVTVTPDGTKFYRLTQTAAE